MASADDLRTIALGLEGTIEQRHHARTAFKVDRIYATLDADGRRANICLPLDEQEFRLDAAPDIYSAIGNSWGSHGWTTVTLSNIALDELELILRNAWQSYGIKPRKGR